MELDPLVTSYLENYPAAAASSLQQLNATELSEFLAITPSGITAHILPHMMPTVAAEALTRLDVQLATDILAKMPNEAAVLTMRSMNRELHYTFYRKMPRVAALRLRLQMRYPEALVGSLVDSDAITLQPDQRVSDALKLIRGGKRRVAQQIYVVNKERHVMGYVDLTTLIANREWTPLSRIRQNIPVVLNTRSPLRTVEELDAWLSFDSLPVVDRLGSFQGVLRREAIVREDHSQLRGISQDREFSRTHSAITDVFLLFVGSLLASKNSLATFRKRDK